MAAKPGRRPRSAEQIQETQAKIVSTALTLFQEEGYDAVSIRRLAKDVGCAPMTIYAHFAGKIEILQHLWAVVLDKVFAEIKSDLETANTPQERLKSASRRFVNYWLEHPDHFRMVFMSNDIARDDVGSFIHTDGTRAHFKVFHDLVAGVLVGDADVRVVTDALIIAMIGNAFCFNTIADYPWTDAMKLVDLTLSGLVPGYTNY